MDCPHLSFTEEAKKYRKNLFDLLNSKGSFEGEELFYPVLWEKQYSVFDYFSESTPVFFVDYNRIENSIDNIAKEYTGMYRKARLELPVLPPQDITFKIEDIHEKINKSVRFCTILSEENKDALKVSSSG